MGWATGSEIANELWKEIKGYVAPGFRKIVSKKIFNVFKNHDADDWAWQDKENDLFHDFLKENYPKILLKIRKGEDWEWDELKDKE